MTPAFLLLCSHTLAYIYHSIYSTHSWLSLQMSRQSLYTARQVTYTRHYLVFNLIINSVSASDSFSIIHDDHNKQNKKKRKVKRWKISSMVYYYIVMKKIMKIGKWGRTLITCFWLMNSVKRFLECNYKRVKQRSHDSLKQRWLHCQIWPCLIWVVLSFYSLNTWP